MLMHQLLLDNAERRPSQTAFRWVDRDVTLTNAEAVAAMERFAGALHHLGVRKGDRVTIFAHNGMDYLVGMFACWRIGAIAALVNVRFADQLPYYFADHTPSVVIYTHDMGDAGARRGARGAVGPASRLHGRSAGGRAFAAGAAGGRLPAAARSRGTRARSRICPTRRARPASRRAPASATSRPCGRRAASASGCASRPDDVSFGPTALSSSYQLVGNLLAAAGGRARPSR